MLFGCIKTFFYSFFSYMYGFFWLACTGYCYVCRYAFCCSILGCLNSFFCLLCPFFLDVYVTFLSTFNFYSLLVYISVYLNISACVRLHLTFFISFQFVFFPAQIFGMHGAFGLPISISSHV